MRCLADKSIVVTGAGRGLGEAYARLAAREGARVLVNDVDGEAADTVAADIRRFGGTALASDADIGSWETSGALIAQCLRDFGAVDGLINNAGVFHMSAPEDERPDTVDRTLRVNINGTVYCGLHALTAMRKRGRGAIVNVTSGAHAGYPQMAVYGATKGAVASLTYGWASDVAGTEIRVNAIAPIARTRMYDQMLSVGDTRPAQTGLDISPDRNAAIAIYLLSDLAHAVNGQIVRVDFPRLSMLNHPAYVIQSV
jgi:NAD(P)-dependent dehydrogenase (short-subunit alcohol dehydrogenase family)